MPTPLGLASYFSGGWYGGAPTCTTYQVTSVWCNLSSLVLLTYICVNCHIAVRRLVRLKPPGRCPSCHRTVLAADSAVSESRSGHVSSENGHKYEQTAETSEPRREHDERNQQLQHSSQRNIQSPGQDSYGQCNGVNKTRQKLSLGIDASPIVLGYAENSLVDIDFEDEANKMGNTSTGNGIIKNTKRNTAVSQASKAASTRSITAAESNDACKEKPQSRIEEDSTATVAGLDASDALLTQNARTVMACDATLQQTNSNSDRNAEDGASPRSNPCSNLDQHYGPESQSSILGAGECHTRDYVSLALFFLFSMTLGISSLPVAGFGPDGMPHGDTSCRSWLVPTPILTRERAFFVAFLTLVYFCLLVGCGSGICVCMQVILSYTVMLIFSPFYISLF